MIKHAKKKAHMALKTYIEAPDIKNMQQATTALKHVRILIQNQRGE